MDKVFISVIVLSLLFSGCSHSDDIIDQTAGGDEINEAAISNLFGKSENPYVPVELSSEEETITEGLWNFSMRLLRSSLDVNPNENVIVSPLSAMMVSGMIANSLDLNDRIEFLNSIVGIDNIEALNSFLRKSMTELPRIDKTSNFSTANLMWLKNPYSPTEEYGSVLESVFDATIMANHIWGVDQISAINRWSEDHSNGEITKIFSDDTDKSNIDWLWLNILYFRGAWSNKFDKSQTQRRAFFCNDGKTQYVEMMSKSDRYIFASDEFLYENVDGIAMSVMSDDQFTQLTMPYGNSAYCFTAVLPPKNNQDIRYVLDNFTYDSKLIEEIKKTLDSNYEIGKKYADKSTGVVLPKLKFNEEIDLIPVLRKMGAENIFAAIDFKTISNLYSKGQIKLFQQNINFATDEEGSELKAVTEADGAAHGSLYGVEFNRPFVYLVWERSTGAVLLAGVYMHP